MAGNVMEFTDANWKSEVLESDQPVIVDFWAPWCGPCKQLGPALEKVVRQANGKVRMVKINVDENQQLAAQMRVQSIPAVFAFVNGQPVDGFMGALPESQLKQFVDRLGSQGGMAEEIEAALAEAQAALQVQDKILRTFPEVATVFGKAGRANTSTDPAPFGMMETTIVLKPHDQWRPVATWYSDWAPDWMKPALRRITSDRLSTDALVAEMNEALALPGDLASQPLIKSGARLPAGVAGKARGVCHGVALVAGAGNVFPFRAAASTAGKGPGLTAVEHETFGELARQVRIGAVPAGAGAAIADDQRLVRTGFRVILGADGIDVVGEAELDGLATDLRALTTSAVTGSPPNARLEVTACTSPRPSSPGGQCLLP